MKYIITDKNELRQGHGFHFEIAKGCEGKVIAAGHCYENSDGTWDVWGQSLHFGIKSKPKDAEKIKEILEGE